MVEKSPTFIFWVKSTIHSDFNPEFRLYVEVSEKLLIFIFCSGVFKMNASPYQ